MASHTSRTLLGCIFSLVCVASCGRSGINEGATLTSLPNHTPAIVNGAQETGHVNPEQALRLLVALPTRNQQQLDAFVNELYDPQSPQFQQYLTPDEFAATYHPTAAQVAQVRQALQQAGITVDDDAHGTLLGANASASQAEAFFHTQINTYVDPNGTTFYAPGSDVAVSENLPVAAVFGLHTPFPWKTDMQISNVGRELATNPQTGAAQIRSAYNVPSTATGKGQVVGLFELDAYVQSDIQAYAKNNGITAAPLTNILIDNFSGQVQDAGAQGEVTLDIELVNALMPAAKEIRVYETQNGQGMDEWNEIANPTLGDKELVSVISCSWGSAENQGSMGELQAESAIFQQMAAQGQSALAASGDSGSKADGTNVGVGDPASQPFVVGVGGTSLSTGANGVYGSEVAWTGGGGGISGAWPIPVWQKSAIPAGSQASTTMRNVPDVSADADPGTGFEIFVQGQGQGGVGGTSCAAPLWAGLTGLVNEGRANAGLPPMGFLSPALYLVGGSSTLKGAFHDITTGNNGTYNAATGFDDATGLGSFDAAKMIQTLSSGYGRSTFGAPVGLTPTAPTK